MAIQNFEHLKESIVRGLKRCIADYAKYRKKTQQKFEMEGEYDVTIRIAHHLLDDFPDKIVVAGRSYQKGSTGRQSDLTIRNADCTDTHIIEIKRGELRKIKEDLEKTYPGQEGKATAVWAICFEITQTRPSPETLEYIYDLLGKQSQKVVIYAIPPGKGDPQEFYEDLRRVGFTFANDQPYSELKQGGIFVLRNHKVEVHA